MDREFPLLKNTTYLNTAYVGLMSKALTKHRRANDDDYLKYGDIYKIKAYEQLDASRETLANFLGSKLDQTFFVPNFSIGIRMALSFVPKKFRFLTIEEEYPSLISAINENGFELVVVPQSNTVEDSIASALESNSIDVLAVSLVQYTSGLMIDFDVLTRLKKKHPQLLIIGDGTQYVGAEHFDFKSSPFDVVSASGYKWLLAGFGNGFLTLSDRFFSQAHITPSEVYDKIYAGHFSMIGVSSLCFAINRLQEQGFSELIAAKQKLSIVLRNELKRLKLLNPLIANRKKHSSIYSIPNVSGRYERMQASKISCALRGDGIRVSVHFYNSEEDIYKLVQFLEKETKS